MKLNKKGFTLIELLAVIVVLAIIALIGYTAVGPIINDSRNSAAANNIMQYEHALEVGCSAYQALNPAASSISVANAESKANFTGTKPTGEWTLGGTGKTICEITRPGTATSNGISCKYADNKWTCGS